MTDEEMAEKYANSYATPDLEDSFRAYMFEASKDGFLAWLKAGRQQCYKPSEKEHEWHYVKDGDFPRQDEHTCFSIEVLASNKKWVYYQFDSGKWFCGNKEVKVTAWKEIVFPKENE